jgi:hypothetical protein
MNEQKKDDAVLPIPEWLREASKAAGQTFPTTCYLCGEKAAVEFVKHDLDLKV